MRELRYTGMTNGEALQEKVKREGGKIIKLHIDDIDVNDLNRWVRNSDCVSCGDGFWKVRVEG
jgi:hypothetical protein